MPLQFGRCTPHPSPGKASTKSPPRTATFFSLRTVHNSLNSIGFSKDRRLGRCNPGKMGTPLRGDRTPRKAASHSRCTAPWRRSEYGMRNSSIICVRVANGGCSVNRFLVLHRIHRLAVPDVRTLLVCLLCELCAFCVNIGKRAVRGYRLRDEKKREKGHHRDRCKLRHGERKTETSNPFLETIPPSRFCRPCPS